MLVPHIALLAATLLNPERRPNTNLLLRQRLVTVSAIPAGIWKAGWLAVPSLGSLAKAQAPQIMPWGRPSQLCG